MNTINKVLKEISEIPTVGLSDCDQAIAVEKLRTLSTIALTESVRVLSKLLKKAAKGRL